MSREITLDKELQELGEKYLDVRDDLHSEVVRTIKDILINGDWKYQWSDVKTKLYLSEGKVMIHTECKDGTFDVGYDGSDLCSLYRLNKTVREKIDEVNPKVKEMFKRLDLSARKYKKLAREKGELIDDADTLQFVFKR